MTHFQAGYSWAEVDELCHGNSKNIPLVTELLMARNKRIKQIENRYSKAISAVIDSDGNVDKELFNDLLCDIQVVDDESFIIDSSVHDDSPTNSDSATSSPIIDEESFSEDVSEVCYDQVQPDEAESEDNVENDVQCGNIESDNMIDDIDSGSEELFIPIQDYGDYEIAYMEIETIEVSIEKKKIEELAEKKISEFGTKSKKIESKPRRKKNKKNVQPKTQAKKKGKKGKHGDMDMKMLDEIIAENEAKGIVPRESTVYEKPKKKRGTIKRLQKKKNVITVSMERKLDTDCMSPEAIQFQIDDDRACDDIAKTLKKETKKDRLAAEQFWSIVAQGIYQRELNAGEMITCSPEDFYQQMLQSLVIQLFLGAAREMEDNGVFEIFDGLPLVICSFQKKVDDCLPVIDGVLPAYKLHERGLIPDNYDIFNPFGKDVLAYGLFYSFKLDINFFVTFFRNEGTHVTYYSSLFDRHLTNMHTMLTGIESKIAGKDITIESGQMISVGQNGEVRELAKDNVVFLNGKTIEQRTAEQLEYYDDGREMDSDEEEISSVSEVESENESI